MKPIQFVVNAIVTTSDLQFDLSEVDFGYCSMYYSVKKSIGLTNLSLLPQEFGFVGIPEVLAITNQNKPVWIYKIFTVNLRMNQKGPSGISVD